MNSLPTDRKVLRCIYEMYTDHYPGPTNDEGRGENDPYLPIDISAVAEKLQCQVELLHGRLYFHLDAKYRYKQDTGASVNLFLKNFAGKRHCVNFPYLASILAGHDEEYRRQKWSLVFSIVALVLSLAAIITQVLTQN